MLSLVDGLRSFNRFFYLKINQTEGNLREGKSSRHGKIQTDIQFRTVCNVV
jgi:hypothetical protein